MIAQKELPKQCGDGAKQSHGAGANFSATKNNKKPAKMSDISTESSRSPAAALRKPFESAASLVSYVPAAKVSVVGTNSAASSIASYHHGQGSVGGSESTRSSATVDSRMCESSRICGTVLVSSQPSPQRPLHHGRKQTVAPAAAPTSLGPVKKRPRLLTQDLTTTAAAAKPLPVVNQLQPIAPAPTKIILLGQPNDAQVLNPLHVFVRQQIEVFKATAGDMCAPAPGRKNRIQLHQIGLRCIHCSHMPSKERVKRAVCYPSSVARVYNSVSDMKFDHFIHCKGLPEHLRHKLQTLKEECKNGKPQTGGKKKPAPNGSASSTAQYYHDAARQMGMLDTSGGVFLAKDVVPAATTETMTPSLVSTVKANNNNIWQLPSPTSPVKFSNTKPTDSIQPVLPKNISDDNIVSLQDFKELVPLGTCSGIPPVIPDSQQQQPPLGSSTPLNFLAAPWPLPMNSHVRSLSASSSSNSLSPKAGSYILSSPEDANHLNPLHCFVRRHVEYFVADETDIAAPSPGRKTRVVLGQVGLRCIHCATSGDRVKRSVCYPASVAGIYHSVSNMKFDHFGKCRSLPADERARFEALRASCSRQGGRRGSSSTTNKNKSSTGQYYEDSARQLGLVDSESGIRFRSDCGEKQRATPVDCGNNSVATDGISALMIAASVRAAWTTGNAAAV